MLRKRISPTTSQRRSHRSSPSRRQKLTVDSNGLGREGASLVGEFNKFPKVLASSVSVRLLEETKYLVNTEGTRLQHGQVVCANYDRRTQRPSTAWICRHRTAFEAEDAVGISEGCGCHRRHSTRSEPSLTKLLDAPVVDAFVGPAILSGRASGVFFHEIFGHRIEGHRQKDESDQQTFTKMVGSKVLAGFPVRSCSIRRKRNLAGQDLNGSYSYDDEGVKPRPVQVVESGTLKTFLMSRSPIKGFLSIERSWSQAGRDWSRSRVSRILSWNRASKFPTANCARCSSMRSKRQGKPYGFYFEHVTGGYTTTGRSSFQSFKVIPLVVYRVYPDGRPDELVRGVDIVGTPLSSFARILATSDKLEVFNGYCGAESGSVPVSAVSPAILVSELEIQKKEKGRDRPPLLPAPPSVGGHPMRAVAIFCIAGILSAQSAPEPVQRANRQAIPCCRR